jgi:hypothetical protein
MIPRMVIYMDLINKPVDMIGWFSEDGRVKPEKCRFQEGRDEYLKIRIEKILEEREEKKGKKRIIIYRCQSIINEHCREYEMIYDVSDCRWELRKFR